MQENYFCEDLLGFKLGVFLGVFLLSRLRWSGLPVDFAIGFGPGLRATIVILYLREQISQDERYEQGCLLSIAEI